MISFTSDFATSLAPHEAHEEFIRDIAEGGFRHLHWCHRWNDDVLYLPCEIRDIQRQMNRFSLVMNGVHASTGEERCYWSTQEYLREAGVELVRNRMELAAETGTDRIVLHTPYLRDGEPCWKALARSLDELEPVSRQLNVMIAVENSLNDASHQQGLEWIWNHYAPDYIGFCYDSGHGNLFKRTGLDFLEKHLDRLCFLHLNDNGGKDQDEHKIPFDGAVDWKRLAGLLARSTCAKNLNLELSIRFYPECDRVTFVKKAHAAATRFETMVQELRQKSEK